MELRERRTLWGYAATRVLDTPFWGLYNMLPFILYKDLGATPFEVAALISLRPILSLLSTYWSSPITGRPDKLVNNIITARVISYLPFFFFPFISAPWFYILAYGFYMMFTLGALPAWMEILKLNLPKNTREKVFSYTQAFGYMGGGLFPFIIGWALDDYFQAWRWLFPLASSLSLLALIFQKRIILSFNKTIVHTAQPLKEKLVQPWKGAWKVLSERPDFASFQLGFMFVGIGLMIIQPALPVYFADRLHLSYLELALAITLTKGIGFAVTSPYWARSINRYDIFTFSAAIALLTCLFPLCLMLAQSQLLWLYVGYLLYGIAQSGNELTWNMSGPIFAREGDSSQFTSVNVLAIGLRGALIPMLGSLLITYGSSTLALISGSLFCLYGGLRLYRSVVRPSVQV
jgi:MFS family permease